MSCRDTANTILAYQTWFGRMPSEKKGTINEKLNTLNQQINERKLKRIVGRLCTRTWGFHILIYTLGEGFPSIDLLRST